MSKGKTINRCGYDNHRLPCMHDKDHPEHPDVTEKKAEGCEC